MVNKIKSAIPYIVSFIGLLVMVGWLINSQFLIQINSEYTSMKFVTSALFLISGFQLINIKNLILFNKVRKTKQFISLFLVSMVIIILSLMAFFSPFIIENFIYLFPVNKIYDPWTTIPHIPSVATLFCFLLISSVQILLVLKPQNTFKILTYAGRALIVIGTVAFLGNLLQVPTLFYVTIWGGGMAIHSAFLFIIIGYFFIYIRNIFLEKN